MYNISTDFYTLGLSGRYFYGFASVSYKEIELCIATLGKHYLKQSLFCTLNRISFKIFDCDKYLEFNYSKPFLDEQLPECPQLVLTNKNGTTIKYNRSH